jgi:hypothetical protein
MKKLHSHSLFKLEYSERKQKQAGLLANSEVNTKLFKNLKKEIISNLSEDLKVIDNERLNRNDNIFSS